MTDRSKRDKINLHVRNRNRNRYDLEAMAITNPELQSYIQPNKVGKPSINFSDPFAVKLLNKSILNHYYGISYWEFPDDNLCPPIPGRAEYIHYMADLLSEHNSGKIPCGSSVTCLDIGVGASCIYPIIGVVEYDWNFIGSDMDQRSIESAQHIVSMNPSLKEKVSCRLQKNAKQIFKGIIGTDEKIDLTICNPPFHASVEDAMRGTRRKVRNLTGKKIKSPTLNFSGNVNELIYKGGELQFISNMIMESKQFQKSCFWFSTLVSKESNLKKIYSSLNKMKPTEIKEIQIKTGNKVGRVLAWTYLTFQERKMWNKN